MKALALLLICGFLAEAAPSDPPSVFIGRIQPVAVSKGSKAEALIPVRVVAGFHVQANPASNPQLIPTKLELPASPGLSIGSPIYPEGKSYRLQGSPTELKTYDGQFVIRVPITLTGKMTSNSVVLTGKLKFQACNDKICFFPANVPVHIPVNSASR